MIISIEQPFRSRDLEKFFIPCIKALSELNITMDIDCVHAIMRGVGVEVSDHEAVRLLNNEKAELIKILDGRILEVLRTLLRKGYSSINMTLSRITLDPPIGAISNPLVWFMNLKERQDGYTDHVHSGMLLKYCDDIEWSRLLPKILDMGIQYSYNSTTYIPLPKIADTDLDVVKLLMSEELRSSEICTPAWLEQRDTRAALIEFVLCRL